MHAGSTYGSVACYDQLGYVMTHMVGSWDAARLGANAPQLQLQLRQHLLLCYSAVAWWSNVGIIAAVAAMPRLL